MKRSFAAALLVALPAPALAQDTTDPREAPPEIEAGVPDAIADARVGLAHRPLGWLSDPEEEPADFFEALVGGKVHLHNRFRIELADTTGRDSSTAITNRIRLGYETKPFHGFSAMVEFENVWSPDKDNYFVPATGSGTPTRTVVADPTGTEVNQFYARFAERLGGVRLDVRAGRQRILHDDQRFIGNVGWRQFEQTYDSVRVQTDLGVEGLDLEYAYVWFVQRIFGPDGPNWDSDSHLIRASYEFAPELRATTFVYLLDFRDDAPADSTDTWGVRVSGRTILDEAEDYTLRYEATYARQSGAGPNPISYDADFFAVEAGLNKKGLGGVFAGYQFLGSDRGEAAFRFPLGTNHAFQGFADNFLATPNDGLQNLYAGLNTQLPWEVNASATYHRFWTDRGGDDLGWELDGVLSKAITPNWSVLLKGAYYDGSSGEPDTTRFWIQTEFSF